MDPLRALEEDNLLLASVVEALSEFAKELADNPSKPQTTCTRRQRLMEFLTALSTLTHNEKEDSLLFPAMVQAGGDWDRGPIAQAREAHMQQGHLLAVLYGATQQQDAWSGSTIHRVQAAIEQYVEILSRSISTAHDTLYPTARQTVPPAQLSELSQRLGEFDTSGPDPEATESEWVGKLSLPPPALVS